jgi:hypothetical protein
MFIGVFSVANFLVPHTLALTYSGEDLEMNFFQNTSSMYEKLVSGGQIMIDSLVPSDTGEFVIANTSTRLFLRQKKAGHIETPGVVKAIYMTACVGGTPSLRDKLVKLVNDTELNSVVLNVKDETGYISFESNHPKLKDASGTCVIADLKNFLEELHGYGIYTIGRIAVFQDPRLVKLYPEIAVKDLKGDIWKDRKGISWIDVGAQEAWEYILILAKESYNLGFDEINFDYIRFPSDGDMKDISYPFSENKQKPEVLESFFKYVADSLDEDIPTSADLFGMTTTNYDDLNIGQVLEKAMPHFDYIMPMVYPSHYPPTFSGFKNPAEHPYEIIYQSMTEAVTRAKAIGYDSRKIRPWFQDFDLGTTYTPDMVRAQITASYNSDVDSWALWSASNVYTKEALEW